MRVLLVGILPPYDSSFSLPLATLKAYALQWPDLREALDIQIQLYTTEQALNKDDGIAQVDFILSRILSAKPTLIGFSCYVWNIDIVLRLSELLRALSPDTTIILGGPQVSSSAQDILHQHPAVDIVVRGEGEQSLADILRHYLCGDPSLEKIGGIAFRHSSGIAATGPRVPLNGLDAIPSIVGSGLVPEVQGRRRVIWETARGCAFDCGYCYYGGENRGQIRSYSLGRVEHDLSVLMESNVEWVTCIDATFNYDPRRTEHILQHILDHNRNSKFLFSIKVELLNLACIDILNALAEHKAIGELEIGLQSTNPEALRNIGRTWTPTRFAENLALFSPALRAITRIDLIYGIPGDTYEGFKTSLGYVLDELDIDRLSVYQLCVLPGTRLFADAKQWGLIFDKHPPHHAYMNVTWSFMEMERASALATGLALLSWPSGRAAMRRLKQEFEMRLVDLLENYVQWRAAHRLSLGEADLQKTAALFVADICVRLDRPDAMMDLLPTLLQVGQPRS